MGGFNYREFRRYRNNFMKMYNSFYNWLYGFMYEQGMKFIATVKPLTPVDTGDLRDHWTLEQIEIEGDNIKCWFVNPMEYTTHVEYGHAKPYKSGASEGSADWVDGFFMMTNSLASVERELPVEFNASFEAFLRGRRLY